MAEKVDVLVIGAGLAGLAAAHHLSMAGREVVVVEASDQAGGRMRTRTIDGYRIDRGFQVVNPAYPELRRLGLIDELRLRPMRAGVTVSMGRATYTLGDPLREPSTLISSAVAPLGSPLAKARLALYALHCVRSPAADLIEQDDSDVESALLGAGVSRMLYRSVLEPFLTGVFLDAPHAVSRRYGDLILRAFVGGTPSLPADGAQALPAALVRRLGPGVLRMNTSVVALSEGRVETSQGTMEADAVVLAADPHAAARLLGVSAPVMKPCTTYYHAVHRAPSDAGFLRVDGRQRGPVVNSAVLSAVAPEYAPPGMHLVASTTLSAVASAEEERAVRAHLALLWGSDTRQWELIATEAVPEALPVQRPGRPVARPQQVGERMWVAGDHMDTPSQQGALISGRRAARAVLGT
jgi:predicted NAD/FAD-dependent oxidoreductase